MISDLGMEIKQVTNIIGTSFAKTPFTPIC